VPAMRREIETSTRHVRIVLAVARGKGHPVVMSRKALDRNQQAELVRLRQQNSRWTSRSLVQRFALSTAAILVTWSCMSLVGWFLAAHVGTSPVPIGIAVVLAVLIAVFILARAIWPNKMAEWAIRMSMSRNKDLDRPFFAFGDLRRDDFPSEHDGGSQTDS
jgi:F0F1-type ATP synthase assembly protein I